MLSRAKRLCEKVYQSHKLWTKAYWFVPENWSCSKCGQDKMEKQNGLRHEMRCWDLLGRDRDSENKQSHFRDNFDKISEVDVTVSATTTYLESPTTTWFIYWVLVTVYKKASELLNDLRWKLYKFYHKDFSEKSKAGVSIFNLSLESHQQMYLAWSWQNWKKNTLH